MLINNDIRTDSYLCKELKVPEKRVTFGSMKDENAKFSERLNAAADNYGMAPKGSGRQIAMGKMFNVSQKGARKWLEGESIPKTSRAVEIANRLGVNFQWLMSGQGEMTPSPDMVINEGGTTYVIEAKHATRPNHAATSKVISVPLLTSEQASTWQPSATPSQSRWIDTTAKVSSASFAMIANGDSMLSPSGSPSIPEGAVVIIDTEEREENGKIIAVTHINSNETVLKKLVIDGPNAYLKPLNPEYKNILMDSSWKVIGTAKRVEMDL